jgi:hypothetical protein
MKQSDGRGLLTGINGMIAKLLRVVSAHFVGRSAAGAKHMIIRHIEYLIYN